MAKSLFKNYTFQLDKNERKILTTFCNTMIKQMSTDDRFGSDMKSFNSIVDKLNSGEDEVKFTKDEKTKLVFRLKENVTHMKNKASKGFFLIRWFYKSAYSQYDNLLQNHFTD
ncbi:MAG: hypothetical protein CVV24_05710 [Ignavibacteriae bacterium HGW-Ignavibacteriae-3]|nr:MAG: hypothetical protein CVV24_05710 [Ignavibacteriae bacterium HGW-Ignavibacteriae-3]